MQTREQIQDLFQNQLSAHAEEIASKIHEKFGEVEGLNTTIQEYLASANLNMDAKPTKSKSIPKKPKPRKERDPEGRCQARVWGEKHDGTEQCSFSAGTNGLCTKHSKAEELCCIPCSLDENGKRKGLWMGRITQFQEGEPGIAPYKNVDGVLCIEWSSGIMKKHIENAIEEGSCRQIKKQSTKKKKGDALASLTAKLASGMESSLEVSNITPPVDNNLYVIEEMRQRAIAARGETRDLTQDILYTCLQGSPIELLRMRKQNA